MPFTLEPCLDKAKWDAFAAASPQNNIFCRTPFLDAAGDGYELWLVSDGGKPQLGAVVMLKDGTASPAPLGPTLYQGLLFSKELEAEPAHRRIKAALEAAEFLLQSLEARHSRLCFNLHYGLGDLRALQWFHYHQPESGRFRLELSYTGLIDLASCKDFDAYLAQVRKVRRYEYNRAGRDGLKVEASRDVDLLDRLHALTIENQGHGRTAEEAAYVRNISRAALEKGFGEMKVCLTPEGQAASAILFVYDERKAYYLFGANHPDFRDTNSGTYLLMEMIRGAKERGLESVDVCGINSPNRGDFKTSLAAAPSPYFTAAWERP